MILKANIYIYWRTVCFDNDVNIICHHLYFLSKVFFHISTTFITCDIKSKNTFRILNNTLEEEQSFSLFLILSSLLEDLKISFFFTCINFFLLINESFNESSSKIMTLKTWLILLVLTYLITKRRDKMWKRKHLNLF